MKLLEEEFQIIGLSSVTPIGGCVANQYASIHAQLSRFELVERDDVPALHVARINGLPMDRLERIQRLLMGALSQCARTTLRQEAEVPVWLALPADIDARQLVARGARFGLLHVGEVVQIAEGRASVLLALQRAGESLRAGHSELACVVGVDVVNDAESIAAFDQRGMLLTEERPWGLVPSEGSGALMLASDAACTRHGFMSLARVRGVASARETPLAPDEPRLAEALSDACHAVLDMLPPGQRVDDIYCDLNGVRERSEEWSNLAPRILKRCRDVMAPVLPALQTGELGHATGALLLSQAVADFVCVPSVPCSALVWGASDEGARAAVLLESTDAPMRSLRPATSRAPELEELDRRIVDDLFEEACFLSVQRAQRLAEQEQTPLTARASVDACERRLEQHLEGLFVAHERALPEAEELAQLDGYPYVAVRVAVMRDDLEVLRLQLMALNLDDGLVHAQVKAALAHGAGARAARIARLLDDAALPPSWQALGLWLIGDAGATHTPRFLELATLGPDRLGASFPWAARRVGTAAQVPQLVPWLEHKAPSFAQAAALAYLRIERAGALNYLRHALHRPGLLAAFAMTAEPGDHATIIAAACAQDGAEGCLALGLLGTSEVLPHLLVRLDAHPAAVHAARALQLVLGREPLEDHVQSSKLEDYQLTGEELQRRRAGDDTVGTEQSQLRRLAQTGAAWEPLCRAHAARFPASQRTRLGMPLGLASELSVLIHPNLARSVVALCASDLSTRGASDVWLPHDARGTDLDVAARQIQLLTARRTVRA